MLGTLLIWMALRVWEPQRADSDPQDPAVIHTARS